MSPHKRIVLVTVFIGLAIAAVPQPSDAQVRGRARIMVGGYFGPLWYDPWWGYGFYQPGPYPYPPYGYGRNPEAALRLDVQPKDAAVYVDGYYVGIVDDFNGVFQRLHVAPGEHDLTLYRDGYRTVAQHLYVTPDSTFKVKYRMQPLVPGEAPEPRPVPSNPPLPVVQAPLPFPPANRPAGVESPPRQPGAQSAGNGTLEIRLQPADAELVIDGQPWPTSGQGRIQIDASEGRHTVQVRKAGYVGYLTDVQVRWGETTVLNVSLRPQS